LQRRNVEQLPANLKDRIQGYPDKESLETAVRRGLIEISRQPARVQSLMGLITAGPVKSAKYLTEKIQKRFKM
jgi:hypothetical protein